LQEIAQSELLHSPAERSVKSCLQRYARTPTEAIGFSCCEHSPRACRASRCYPVEILGNEHAPLGDDERGSKSSIFDRLGLALATASPIANGSDTFINPVT
jgi:hypothetical protein